MAAPRRRLPFHRMCLQATSQVTGRSLPLPSPPSPPGHAVSAIHDTGGIPWARRRRTRAIFSSPALLRGSVGLLGFAAMKIFGYRLPETRRSKPGASGRGHIRLNTPSHPRSNFTQSDSEIRRGHVPLRHALTGNVQQLYSGRTGLGHPRPSKAFSPPVEGTVIRLSFDVDSLQVEKPGCLYARPGPGPLVCQDATPLSLTRPSSSVFRTRERPRLPGPIRVSIAVQKYWTRCRVAQRRARRKADGLDTRRTGLAKAESISKASPCRSYPRQQASPTELASVHSTPLHALQGMFLERILDS
ncbi:hypothetical protein GGR56DRAFT_192364 [Xylariaceae sp. FL0804]|nr:hypothetical protein GGR56DRAFT_192364 [Xylariaceae sp. FL0804]